MSLASHCVLCFLLITDLCPLLVCLVQKEFKEQGTNTMTITGDARVSISCLHLFHLTSKKGSLIPRPLAAGDPQTFPLIFLSHVTSTRSRSGAEAGIMFVRAAGPHVRLLTRGLCLQWIKCPHVSTPVAPVDAVFNFPWTNFWRVRVPLEREYRSTVKKGFFNPR